MRFEDAARAVGVLKEHGLDLADLSPGINTDRTKDVPFAEAAFMVERGARVRREVGIPVAVSWNLGVPAVAGRVDPLDSEAAIRRPDTDRYVAWEVAGSPHSDYHNFIVNTPVRFRGVGIRGILPDTTNCVDPARSRVRLHLVFHAAYERMARWLRREGPPSMAEPVSVDLGRTPPVLVRDELGIARGGIRLADVDAPEAMNTGWNSGGKPPVSDSACRQAGTHQPFDAATLRRLYPTREAYLERVRAVAERNVREGFLLDEDARRVIENAAEAMRNR